MSNHLNGKEVRVQRKGMGRFEGRLFASDGRLYLVVEADDATGQARVSCSIDGTRHVLDMPLTEVSKHLSSGTTLILDNINSPQSASRVLEKDDGWFFSTREGLQGPYPDRVEAEKALGKFIVAAQSRSAAS